MPLKPARAQFQIVGGTKNTASPFTLEPPAMQTMQNVRFQKDGRVSKRLGYTQFVNNVLPSAAGTKIFHRDKELLVSDNYFLYSRMKSPDDWRKAGRLPEIVGLERHGLSGIFDTGSAGAGVYYADIAVMADYKLVTWTKLGATAATCTIYYQLLGIHDEEMLSGSVTSAVFPHVIKINSTLFLLVWNDAVATKIWAKEIDVSSTPSVGAATAIITDALAFTPYEIVPQENNDHFLVVNIRTGGGGQLDWRKFHRTGYATSGPVTLGTAGKVLAKPTLIMQAGTCHVGWWNTTDNTIEVQGINPNTQVTSYAIQNAYNLGVGGDGSACLTLAPKGSTDVWIVHTRYQLPASAYKYPYIEWRSLTQGGTVGATTQSIGHLIPRSRGWQNTEQTSTYICVALYATDANTIEDQRSLLIMDLCNEYPTSGVIFSPRPLAKWANGELATDLTSELFRVGTHFISNNSFFNDTAYVAYTTEDVESGSSAARAVGVEFASIPHHNPAAWAGYVDIGNELYFPGAFGYAYDGAQLFEAYCSYSPFFTVTPTNSAGGTLAPNTVYGYKAVYAWQDRTGRVWRSPPSNETFQTTTGVNLTLSTRIAPLTISLRDSSYLPQADILGPSFGRPLTIEVYRRNITAGETVWIRCAVIANGDTAYQDQLFTDNGLSTANQPLLYTTGGVLQNDSARPHTFSWVFDDRVWNICSDSPHSVQFSRELIGNPPQPVSFSEILMFTLDQDGPNIAGVSMDAYNIIFKKDSIYTMQGSGPDDTGNNFAYTPPVQLTSEVGCVEPRSIVVTSLGVFFRSSRGIELLDRSLSVKFVGADITNSLAAYPNITGAAIVEDQSEIRFTATTTAIDAGVILKYNYLFDKWSVDTLPDAPLGIVNLPSSIDTGNFVTWISRFGSTYQEVPVQFNDYTSAGAQFYVVPIVETPNFKLENLEGFQRVWYATILGQARYNNYSHGPDVQVDCYMDYESVSFTTFYIKQAQLASCVLTSAASGGVPALAIRMHLPRQYGMAIRFKITEAAPISPGTAYENEGIAWYGVLLEYGIERGTGRFNSSQMA